MTNTPNTHVLLPIDGSDYSLAMVQWFTNSFSSDTTRVSLLRVITQIPEIQMEPFEIEAAQHDLKTIRAIIEEAGFTIEHSECPYGYAVDTVCDIAKEWQVDQIMMGSHGRSKLARLMLGSVSSGVLEKSPVPVVIYRDPVRLKEPLKV